MKQTLEKTTFLVKMTMYTKYVVKVFIFTALCFRHYLGTNFAIFHKSNLVRCGHFQICETKETIYYKVNNLQKKWGRYSSIRKIFKA